MKRRELRKLLSRTGHTVAVVIPKGLLQITKHESERPREELQEAIGTKGASAESTKETNKEQNPEPLSKVLERQLNNLGRSYQTPTTLLTFVGNLTLLAVATLLICIIQTLLPDPIDRERRAGLSDSSTPSVGQARTPIEEDEAPQQKPEMENEQIKYIISLMADNLAKLSTGRTFVAEPTPFPDEPLRFEGQNITNFLREYVKRANFYEWPIEKRIERLVDYCDEFQANIIKYSVVEWEEARESHNWDALWKALRLRFRSTDKDQVEESEDAFKAWLFECQNTPGLDLRSYLDTFAIRFHRSAEAGTIREDYKGYYLVKGLNKELAQKVLSKFSATPTEPSSFKYKEIHKMLSKEARVKADVYLLNPAFTQRQAPGSEANPIGYQQNQPFQEPKLHLPPNLGQNATDKQSRPQGMQGVRMPPGAPATQSEVDELVKRFEQMKMNNVTLYAWDPREAELLRDPYIRQEVIGRTTQNNETTSMQAPERLSAWNRTYQGNATNGQYRTTGLQGNNTGNQELGCYACGSLDHRAASCEGWNKLVDNGWVWFNIMTRMWHWGNPNDDRGAMRRLGPAGKRIETTVAEIKGTIGQQVDPLTQKAPNRLSNTPSGPGVANITVTNEPWEQAGLVSEQDWEEEQKRSSAIIRSRERIGESPRLNGMGIVCGDQQQSIQGQAAVTTIPKTDKPTGRRPLSNAVPAVRQGREREEDYFMPPKMVQFRQPEQTDIDMDEPNTEKTTVPAPRRHRLSEKLKPTPDAILQQILGAKIEASVSEILGNIPEVKRRFFSAYYSEQEFKKLKVAAAKMGTEDVSELSEEEKEEPRAKEIGNRYALEPHINAIGANIPSFVAIEAVNGMISRCGRYAPGSTAAPPRYRRENHQPILSRAGMEEGYGLLTSTRREYDRAAGVEHIRRECPRVLIEVNDAKVKALLDTGAELNTIRLQTAEAAGLQVTSLPDEMAAARLMTANGGKESFAGIVWRAPVQVGQVVIETNFFVVRSLSHPIILGNPFLADGRARFEYEADGRTYCHIQDEAGRFKTQFVATHQDPLNPKGIYAGDVLGKGQGA